MALAEDVASPYAGGFAYLALGHLRLLRGEYLLAADCLQKSRAAFLESQSTVMAAAVAAFLGRSFSYLGEDISAIETLESSLRTTLQIGVRVQQPLRMVFLSEAYQHAGRPSEALATAQHALSLAQEQAEEASREYALHQIARLLMDKGREHSSSAVRGIREAQAVAAALHLLPLVARCHDSLARALQSCGATDEAAVEADAATNERVRLGIQAW